MCALARQQIRACGGGPLPRSLRQASGKPAERACNRMHRLAIGPGSRFPEFPVARAAANIGN